MPARRVACLAVVVALCSGCDGSGSSSSPSPIGSTATTITGTLWGQSGSVGRTVTAAAVTSLAVSASATVTATATYSDGTTATVSPTWSSSDTGVATVTSTGTVTGVAAGTTTITGTLGGQSGSVGFTVTAAAVTSLAVRCGDTHPFHECTTEETTVPPEATVQLYTWATYSDGSLDDLVDHLDGLRYSSSDESVATVCNPVPPALNCGLPIASGTVTAVAAGTATITATYEGLSDSVVITVTGSGQP